jgi:DUF4097 and DUF4098 domain-containing protein YvlB
MSTPVQPPTYAPEPPVPAPPSGGVAAWRVVGGIVAAVVVVAATVGVVANFTEQRRTATTTYAQAVSKVVVDTDTGSVELKAGTAGSPVVVEREERSSLGSSARSSESVSGSVLTVRADCRGVIGWCGVGYTVTVPPGTAVSVTTSTGSVEAAGLDGDLGVTTSTGSIELTGLRSARVTAEASTGSVELGFAAPPQDVRAETSTGSVEVVVPRDGTAYAVRDSTEVGSREVTVPVDSSSTRRIEATASTGSVEVRAEP